jgi:hypothetical protein
VKNQVRSPRRSALQGAVVLVVLLVITWGGPILLLPPIISTAAFTTLSAQVDRRGIVGSYAISVVVCMATSVWISDVAVAVKAVVVLALIAAFIRRPHATSVGVPIAFRPDTWEHGLTLGARFFVAVLVVVAVDALWEQRQWKRAPGSE